MVINPLKGKHILLGVSGSIAAYKAADLVRRLREMEAEVQVVMTAAAQGFVTPLTFQALTGKPVHTDLMDPAQEAAMGHIALARWADLLLVAPASADCLARLAQGRANDLFTAVCLATTAPLAVAPSMNQQMWQALATQENIAILRRRGIQVWGPARGDQACGEQGPGRMLEPLELIGAAARRLTEPYLAGRSVLVTAGPTREYLDPVRFLSNRSSGKMGYALAAAAAEAGAEVTLISGPVTLEPPPGVQQVQVESAQQMCDATLTRTAATDIFIGCAAVADYRPTRPAAQKIKKGSQGLALELERTPDTLEQISKLADKPFMVGFAAETEHLETNARHKLNSKGLDMIAANWIKAGRGFEVDDNALTVLWHGGKVELPMAPKIYLARGLIKLIAEHYHAKDSA
ncbi:bifunctional phosphopantothenoylcysteine decarboxylase/phosphopantothenate--cysteine ligase CoaBC [Nitrosococcus wardiae]|uniref:Coenzyme A biosynthesis bifunctional protein CoaBC n=1 Tax=Nitrosococcus wardiae TaxID=1814290 RepID=A0A4P7BX38_9GAMM|nr:bifunctional phosphopantothenoylcysteine decarboxylase/phosphopantothenate--cysteine ligase CoaBC [Nitrosococcus wardiae]QBQ53660.1 bifunctional phosphopantothenoylcysteine decarboxylase/phosphopantothenate--cysteine ligase CoaBC [Nitrosococcus wardiae]